MVVFLLLKDELLCNHEQHALDVIHRSDKGSAVGGGEEGALKTSKTDTFFQILYLPLTSFAPLVKTPDPSLLIYKLRCIPPAAQDSEDK